MSGLLLLLIEVRRDTYLAWAFLLFVLFGFYQLLTGNLGKAKSVLPTEWETKRVVIGKRHNQVMGVILFALLVVFVTVFALLGRRPTPPELLGCLFAIALAGGYAFYRLIKYEEVLCERIGFVCPHCHKPLYEPRSFINVNGRCPKCHKSVLPQGSPLLSTEQNGA